MSSRKKLLKAYRFQRPARIPVNMNINASSWDYYKIDELEQLILDHKILFPGYKKGEYKNYSIAPWRKKGKKHKDSWGCIWETEQNGITGAVIKHPLEKWKYFADLKIPDPDYENGWGKINWNKIEENIKRRKLNNEFTAGSLRHGFLFLTLTYLRGYENIIYDMYDDNKNLSELINIVMDFNFQIVKRYLELGVDMIKYPEDLGTQNNLMISPVYFKKHIKPVYKDLMKPAKADNVLVHMHSDGYIMDLLDDLIDCGVDIINPQDIVNGIDNLKEYKGRVAIDLDIDRQNIPNTGSPQDIDDLIKEEVIKLGSNEGGLSLSYQLLPGVPYENIKTIMDCLEKYSFYYFK